MTEEEKDRCLEVLLYLWFNDKPEELTLKPEFWKTVSNICDLYNIHSIDIAKAVRILGAEENSPTDVETYYLLDQLGLTVRPLRRISGIYWQKQKEFAEKFAVSGKPVVKRRITDIIVKNSIKVFLKALDDLSGIFRYVDSELLGAIL